MTNLQEDTDVLKKLGLTSLESKVYLTLLESGQLNAKKIAFNSQLDRSDTYRVLSKLQEKGLVETEITNPMKFKSIPLLDGIKLLQDRKKEEDENIQVGIKKLLDRHKQCNKKSEFSEDHYILVSEWKSSVRRFKEEVEKSKLNVDQCITWELLKDGTSAEPEFFIQAKQRGVRFRFVVDEPNEDPTQIISSLIEKGSFEVKYLTEKPKVEFAIYDDKEASVVNTIKSKWTGSLFTTNRGITAFFKELFESKWNDAIELPRATTNNG